MIPEPLVYTLRNEFPVTEAAAGYYSEINTFNSERIPYIRLSTLCTDNAFFSVFPQNIVSGSSTPLEALNNIVLTESVAIRMFGDAEKAIGQEIKSLYYFFYDPYIVTAVVKDPPPNTNMSFDALVFYGLIPGFDIPNVRETFGQLCNSNVYLKLNANADVAALEEQLRDYTTRENINDRIELRMLPARDVRHSLSTNLMFTLNFVRLFVAAGILLIVCTAFNFLNLNLGLFRQRMREWRQRMVHGAKAGQLIAQMMFEMTCSILLALVFAFLFTAIVSPLLSGLLDIRINTSELFSLFALCGAALTALMLIAGFIPLWQLSRTTAQRLSERKTQSQPLLRRMAVTMQLAVSVVFIAATLVVMMQMRFVNKRDLGFERSGVIQLSGLLPNMKTSVRTALIDELKTIPQVMDVTTTAFEPKHNANAMEMVTLAEWPGKDYNEKPAFNVIPTDNRFAETLGLNMLAGEWWNESEGNKIVLNEEAVRVMGLDNPVGTNIRLAFAYGVNEMKEYKIAGVVKDFHTLSLRNRILPTIFRQSDNDPESPVVSDNILYVRVMAGQELEAMQRINAILPDVDATMAGVSLAPVGELYDRLNRSEQSGLKMFSALASVCMLISLFGVYAVATASAIRRRKEIAIRKVLGAEVRNIIGMFFREYALIVLLSVIVALPPAYYAIHSWLQGYAYRTDIPLWLPAGIIVAVSTVVMLTVLGQVLKAARSNPADVVKSE